jgi:hypothetical protein
MILLRINFSILCGSFGFAANFNDFTANFYNFNNAFIDLFKLLLLHCNGVMDRSCIAGNGFLDTPAFGAPGYLAFSFRF